MQKSTFIWVLIFLSVACNVFSQGNFDYPYEEKMWIGDWKSAIPMIEKELENSEQVLRHQMALGFCLIERNKLELFDSLLQTIDITEDNEWYPYYCWHKGRNLYKKRKLDDALAALDEGLEKITPTTPFKCEVESGLIEWKGSCYFKREDLESAEDFLLQGLEVKKQCNPSPYTLALAYSKAFQVSHFQSKYEKGLAYANEATKIVHQLHPNQPLVGLSWNNKGVAHRRLGQFEEAVQSMLQALEIGKQIHKNPLDKRFMGVYSNIMATYTNLENIPKVESYLDTLELIQKDNPNYDVLSNIYLTKSYYASDLNDKKDYLLKIPDMGHHLSKNYQRNVSTAYNNLGIYAKESGNLIEAENYYLKALEKLDSLANPRPEKVVSIYFNLGILASKRGQNDKAINHMQYALDTQRKVFGKDNFRSALMYGALGGVYQGQGEMKKAYSYFQKSMALYKTFLSPDHPEIAVAHQRIAKYWLKNDQPEKAIPIIEKAISSLEHNGGFQLMYLPDAYWTLTQALRQTGQKEEAKRVMANTLSMVGFEMENTIPKSAQAISEHDLWAAFKAFAKYMEVLYEDKTPYDNRLTTLSIQMVSRLQSTFFFEGSTFELKEKIKSIINPLIEDQMKKWESTHDQKHLDNIYQLSEIYKSGTLDRPYLRKRKNQSEQVPEELLAKEKNIIYQYEKSYQDLQQFLKNESEDITKIDTTLRSELSRWQNEKKELLAIFQKDYPIYYQSRYENIFTPLKEVQQLATKNKNFYLTNFWGKDYNYSIFISGDTTFAFRVALESIAPTLDALIEELANGHYTQEEATFIKRRTQFIAHAQQLYEKLYAPISTFVKSNDNLLIIPDNMLCFLPYDVLINPNLTKQSSYKKLPYLMRQVNISYDASISLHLHEKKKTSKKKYRYVGFAPSSETGTIAYNAMRSTDQMLVANKYEIEKGQALFNGLSFFGTEATKQQFLNVAGETDIIHLATHGKVNDSIPMQSALLFYNKNAKTEQLKMYEIAQQNFNNELVVLSACETQKGQLQSGEGVLSLARAFQLAGSPNLIHTLWSVNDQVAEKIISRFLEGVADHQNYAQSLQKAKLNYIQEASEYYAHPSYWAAFSYHGKSQFNNSKSFISNRLIYFLGGIILASLFVYFRFR